LFSCNEYCRDKWHLGTFGTLLRMFPVFDLPNNDAGVVIIADIDEVAENKPF